MKNLFGYMAIFFALVMSFSGCGNKISTPEQSPSVRLESNLVSNPGAEDGGSSPDGWWVTNNDPAFEVSWDATKAHTGSHSLRMKSMALTANGWGNDGWGHNKFSMDPARTYLFSFWVTHENSDRQQPNLWINFSYYNGNTYLGSVQHYVDLRAPDGLWQEVRQTIARPDSIITDSSVNSVLLSIYLRDNEAEVWIDDIEFQAMSASDMDLQTKYVYNPMPDIPTTSTPKILAGTGHYGVAKDERGRWWMVRPDGSVYFDISVDMSVPTETTSPTHYSWLTARYGDRQGYFLNNVLPRCLNWGVTGHSAWSYDSWYSTADNLHTLELNSGLKEIPVTQCIIFDEDIDDIYHVRDAADNPLGGTHGMVDPYNTQSTTQMQAEVDKYVTMDRTWIAAYHADNEIKTTALVNYIWSTESRAELANFLQSEYGTIEALKTAWNKGTWNNFTELVESKPQPSSYSSRDYRDYILFSAKAFSDFQLKAKELIRAKDPDVAVFSSRFDFMPRDMAYIDALSVMDAFCMQWASCRGYMGPSPKAMYFINYVKEHIAKPTIITEWHVGSQDTGQYQAGSVNIRHDFVDTQYERGLCYREMLYRLVSHSSVIGEGWFHWYDSDQFPGNNGFVKSSGPDIDQPYQTFVDMMIETNNRVNSVDPECRTWGGILPGEDGGEKGQRMVCLCNESGGAAGLLLTGLLLIAFKRRRKTSGK